MRKVWPNGQLEDVAAMKRREPGLLSFILFPALILLIAPIFAAAQEKIAFTSTRDGDSEIYVMNPDGSSPTRLTHELTNNNGQAQFSFDGRKIVFASGLRTVLTAIHVMNFDGSGLTFLTFHGVQPSFSPDGSRVVFTSQRDGGGNSEIYIMNADGSNQTRLTNTPDLDEILPTFSPDGTKILFTEWHDFEILNFTDEIFVMNADGSNRVQLTNDLGDPGGNNRDAKFSPDGSKIVFSSLRDGNTDVYVMNPDGSSQIRLTTTPSNDYEPTYSPDGSKIAFTSSAPVTSPRDIFVMNSNGSNAVNLTPDSNVDYEPSWADTNAFPSITPAVGITRVRNAGPSNSLIATVDDFEDPPGTLNVTVNGNPNATVNGITISNIFVDAPGNVSADIAAGNALCGSYFATFTLRVTDSGGRFSQAILVVSTTPLPVPGALPGNAFAGVMPGPDGRLYGVTYNCGSTNHGTLYVYHPTLQEVTKLHDFNQAVDGSVLYDELVFDTVSGKFYGTTDNGGPSGLGTVFTFDPVTNQVTTIRSDFGGYSRPTGAPIRSNGYLYGTVGGITGAIYRMAPNGSNFTILHAFTQFSTQPQPLTLGLDGMLYGVTFRGGILCPAGEQYGCGTIFRLKPVLPADLDEQFETIYQFQGPGHLFANPFRHMIYSTDGYLYGSTLYSVFRVDPDDGANLQFIFSSSVSEGGNGFPIIEGTDNRLYLTDYFGGDQGAGTVFSMKKDGTEIKNLRTFDYDSGSNGPYGRLYRNASGIIIGTTEYDHEGGPGTVFVITEGQIFSEGFEN